MYILVLVPGSCHKTYVRNRQMKIAYERMYLSKQLAKSNCPPNKGMTGRIIIAKQTCKSRADKNSDKIRFLRG